MKPTRCSAYFLRPTTSRAWMEKNTYLNFLEAEEEDGADDPDTRPIEVQIVAFMRDLHPLLDDRWRGYANAEGKSA
eukprot:8038520-Pyramimonas_sp.AAC.1